MLLCMWLQIREYQNWEDGSSEQAKVTSPMSVSVIKQSYRSHNTQTPALVHLASSRKASF